MADMHGPPPAPARNCLFLLLFALISPLLRLINSLAPQAFTESPPSPGSGNGAENEHDNWPSSSRFGQGTGWVGGRLQASKQVEHPVWQGVVGAVGKQQWEGEDGPPRRS